MDGDFRPARWRKSTHSPNEQNCVEVATLNGRIGIRDSKNPGAGHIACDPDAWERLLHDIKSDGISRNGSTESTTTVVGD